MYENENQNSQNSYSSDNRQQEYYYTAGNNYNNSQNGTYGTYSGAYSSNSAGGQKQKKPKKDRPFAKKVVTFVALGALFGVTAGAAFSIPVYVANNALQKTQIEVAQAQKEAAESGKTSLSTTAGSLTTTQNSAENATSADIRQIAQNCLPSIVSITNKGVTEVTTMFGTYQQDTSSSGSGIIIGENDTELLIVTNYHVVSGSSELTVVFSYDEDSDEPSAVSAKVKGYDVDKDLAVIAVASSDITDDMRSQIKIATIGDSSSLELGQQVVAIGNALGYGQSVTSGIISALNREVTVTNDDGTAITNKLIQTDAAINPGNSGGALLNMNGELIGINSVKVATSSVEGMGYAIPISDVQSIIEELMLKETRDVVSEEEQGYLGISGTDVTSEISSTYGMPVGVYVNNVYEDSPAAKAGLAKGNIITKFDGQTVKSMTELKSLLTYYKQGETINVVAQVQSSDGYVEKGFTVTLASKDIFGTDAEQSSSSQQQEVPDSNNGNGTYQYPYNFFWPFQK